jgi:hypothetical protein
MNTNLSPWQVQVQGSQFDLEHLKKYFTSAPMLVRADDRSAGFLYESEKFLSCATSVEVLEVAAQELLILSGILKLVRDATEPLRTGAVYRANAAGGRDVFEHIHEGVSARSEAGIVGVTTTDKEGNVVSVPPPPPRTIALSKLALADDTVAKAMRLIAATDSNSWVNLYRIHEVVEADMGGEHSLKKRAWGSSRDLKRFKHSANSVTVAGDRARHGKETDQPPAQPMSLDEANAYVNYVVHAWLATKGA